MKFSLLTVAALTASVSASPAPAPRNELRPVDASHLPIRRDPTRHQPILQRRTGAGAVGAAPAVGAHGETVIVITHGGAAGEAAQGAAKPTVTNLQTVTTKLTVAAPAGTAPAASKVVAAPPAIGTGGMAGMLPPGMGAAQPSGTGALVQQPAPTQSLLPVTAGAPGPLGFGRREAAVAAGLVSAVWSGFWLLA